MRRLHRLLRPLYVQVLIGVAIGALIGHFAPAFGLQLKPLSIAFIRMMRMMVPPIVFCTIVNGIVGMRDGRRIGGTFARALLVFYALTVLALLTGFTAVSLLVPGDPVHLDAASLDAHLLGSYPPSTDVTTFLVRIIPDTFFSAFTSGEVLPVLFIAVLIGLGLLRIGDTGKPIIDGVGALSRLLFVTFDLLMRLAPLGACGAIAATVALYGVAFVGALAHVVFTLYLACLVFVALVMVAGCRLLGIGVLALLRAFREELLIVVGTASTEAVLPRVLRKLEWLGCSRSVAGLVVPAGQSFNLAGTAVYLPVATFFISQAFHISLPPERVAAVMALMLLTSKTGAGITGSGFSALITTLSLFPDIPVIGVAAVVAGDRIMSEARSVTSAVANIMAALLIAAWDGALDRGALRARLAVGAEMPPIAEIDPHDPA